MPDLTKVEAAPGCIGLTVVPTPRNATTPTRTKTMPIPHSAIDMTRRAGMAKDITGNCADASHITPAKKSDKATGGILSSRAFMIRGLRLM